MVRRGLYLRPRSFVCPCSLRSTRHHTKPIRSLSPRPLLFVGRASSEKRHDLLDVCGNFSALIPVPCGGSSSAQLRQRARVCSATRTETIVQSERAHHGHGTAVRHAKWEYFPVSGVVEGVCWRAVLRPCVVRRPQIKILPVCNAAGAGGGNKNLRASRVFSCRGTLFFERRLSVSRAPLLFLCWK